MTSNVAVNFNKSIKTRTPVILANSTVNSGLKRVFHVSGGAVVLLINYKTDTTVTKIFGTPVTKLIFALRMLVISLDVTSLLPVLVDYIATAYFACVFVNSDSLFSFALAGP